MDKKIAKKAGLLEGGLNPQGERLYIGTEAEWDKATSLEDEDLLDNKRQHEAEEEQI